MYFLISFGVIILLLLNYCLWFREWLKSRPWPWSQRYFLWIEPIEIALWKKSETILWARTQMLFGVLLQGMELLQLLNTPELLAFLPEQWSRWVSLLFIVNGLVQEVLRRYTATPLPIVEMPTVGNTPAVNAAIANLEIAKAKAVAAVETQKAAA